MYSSLDRVDLVVKGKGGAIMAHQTDHRDSAELAKNPELNTLFAGIRLLNGRAYAAGQSDTSGAAYVVLEQPPEYLIKVIALADAELHVGGKVQPTQVDLGGHTLEQVMDQAFGRLARTVADREGIEVDADALRLLESSYRETPAAEDDEPTYWTRALELGAFTGEVMREMYGGQWRCEPDGPIPFVFRLETRDATVFPIDKARRYFEEGDDQRPSRLVEVLEAMRSEEERPMLILKPHDWPLRGGVQSRPLLGDTVSPTTEKLPWIVYGYDRPDCFGYAKNADPDQTLEKLHADALVSLATVEVKVDDADDGSGKILLVSGDYFAAEKICDPRFMQSLHERLEAKMLVATPICRGVLLVADGVGEHLEHYLSLCQFLYEQNQEPLTPTPLLIVEGAIAGVLEFQA
ncbi:MAG: hypothetical protein ACYTFT_15475 [Planctomycetota bacterium]|jgi:hypothetical protein